jgi:phosphonate transport system substrate-binding protein
LVLLPWLVLLLIGSWQVAAEPPLIFAPLPLEKPSLTQMRNQPLVDLLARALGRPVEMRLCDNYACLIESLVQGKIDLAELGPLPFLLARDQRPELQPVASFREANGLASYRCVLVAPVDGLESLKSLGALASPPQVALTNAESTCGPTASFWLLAGHDIDLARVGAHYLGGHDAVALAVLRELYPLGGVKDSVARRFHDLGLRVLARSELMPGFVLAALPERLSGEELAALTAVLLQLSEPARAGLQNGHFGFAAFDVELFDRVEAMRAFSMPYLERVDP